MKKFIHIGYPKNFSTSLQNDFFAKHEQLAYLGIGPGLDYADHLVESIFEVYLKSAKGFKYQEQQKRIQDHISALISKAEVEKKKAVVVSSEHLSFAFANDSIDFEEKMKRISSIFGSETHIIMIIRNQFDLIKSLYRESVRVGFPGDFEKYIYLLYKFQDRNYYYDLRYDLVFEVLQRIFGKENVHCFLFEHMRGKDGALLEKNGKPVLLQELSDLLGIDYHATELGHFNEALQDHVIRAKAELNETKRHDLGNIQYDTAEKHRMRSYLANEIQLHEAESVLYGDVITKRESIANAKLYGKFPENEKLSFTADQELERRMRKFYGEGNRRFSEVSGMEMPSAYFELKFR